MARELDPFLIISTWDGQEYLKVYLQHKTYDSVVEGILVLLQPAGEVVGHGGCVVDHRKVGIRVWSRVRLGELGPLAQHVVHQLLAEGGVRGLREKRLLFEDGEEGHRLLKHVNALLQIHPEVDVGPVQPFSHILLLLKSEPVLYDLLIEHQ